MSKQRSDEEDYSVADGLFSDLWYTNDIASQVQKHTAYHIEVERNDFDKNRTVTIHAIHEADIPMSYVGEIITAEHLADIKLDPKNQQEHEDNDR